MSDEGIELQPVGSSTLKPRIPPRHPDTAPGGLGAAYRAAEDKAKAAVHLQEGNLDNVSVWGLVAAGWFTILALPLLLFPRILVFFSQTPAPGPGIANLERDHYDTLTPLESFLALTLALGLVSLALLVFLTLVPSYTPPSPSRWPLLAIIVGLTSTMSVIAWNAPIGGLGKVTGIGNTLVAIWGWWVVVFGQGRSNMANVGKKIHPKRWEKL
ncbi:hypothetical protein BD324DRAFT_615273 [Kockovaella imperatae]|uniref:Transmembrane protein n=1 Tax=Kockovaella imperatae TaxID=4999 RepID=A0A1Y1UPA2_9TREE|nr:hypothetical protein BD324DRAFT_615273 [Kockovaella imperatae]ORX39861.1 hypothetical protein BD324DRAFT_615273 [Kockovaella imperatae]